MSKNTAGDVERFLESQRRDLLNKCAGIFAFISLILVLSYRLMGIPLSPMVMIIAIVVSVILFLVPFISFRIKESGSIGIFLALVVGCATFADAWSVGGVSSGAILLMVQVPLLAAFISGDRAGFYAFLLVTFGLILLTTKSILAVGVTSGDVIVALRIGMFGVVSSACALLLVSTFLHIIQRAYDSLFAEKASAEISSAATSSFISDLAHELRTPLNAIIGFSSLLTEETGKPLSKDKTHEYGDAIHQSGEHLLKLINEILQFSKLETETEELEMEITDPSDLAEACANIMRPVAEARSMHLQVDCQSGAGLCIEANETRIRQVIFNLLSNAFKFSDEGSIVDLTLIRPTAETIAFCVTDNGPGMTADEVAVAMGRFGQLRLGHVKGVESGVGLGLPISANIARLHGGELKVESTPGEGTCVSLILPCTTVELESAA